MQTINLDIKETSSYGEIEGIYENELQVQGGGFDGEGSPDNTISLGTVPKDENDERSLYFILDKTNALILSDVLKRLADEL